jgi:hypothetical protein
MQRERNPSTGVAAKAAPKPLSAAATKKLEAAGVKVWRLRSGEAYATRADRRAARAVRKERP